MITRLTSLFIVILLAWFFCGHICSIRARKLRPIPCFEAAERFAIIRFRTFIWGIVWFFTGLIISRL
jgi:hypothetical protein